MREDTKVTKVFRFEELGGDAQEKALEALWDINVFYEWWDSIYADADEIGVKIDEFDLERRYCRGTFDRDEFDAADGKLYG